MKRLTIEIELDDDESERGFEVSRHFLDVRVGILRGAAGGRLCNSKGNPCGQWRVSDECQP